MTDQVTATAADYAVPSPIPTPMKTWAVVENGFVTTVKRGLHYLPHPFSDLPAGASVLDVSGVPCAPGFIVDSKGNVAPNDSNRTEPLMAGEPAYHDRPNPLAMHTVGTVAAMQTATPHPTVTAGANQAPGKQDNRGTATATDKQAATK